MPFPVRDSGQPGLTQAMQLPFEKEDGSAASLQRLCGSMLQEAFPAFQDARIEASFYPYIGLTHTIRRGKAGWVIRISDHCRHAPQPVLEAIVMILAAKVMRRKPGREYLQTYDLYRNTPSIMEAVRERRMTRGRKRIAGDAGKHYSLRDLFREINDRYFNNQIEIRKIGWGFRRSWARLGHYDPAHRTITLSPVLDSPRVPKFVVTYIVYHEMLHSIFEDAPVRGAGRHHPPEFRRADQAYPDYARAKEFLREYCRRRK
jgi:hypothetical protein